MSRPSTLRFGLWGGLLLGFVMPALGSGCRPGEGDRCFCHGECRGGLVCAASGATLRPGQCVTDLTNNVDAGVCIESEGDSQGGEGSDPPPFWDLRYDLPKTDFAFPDDSTTTDSTTDSSTTMGTDSGSSGTDTGSSGTDGASTGTGGSSGGSTGSTGNATGSTSA